MIRRHEGIKAIMDTEVHVDRCRNIELWQHLSRTELNNPERLNVRRITEYRPAKSSRAKNSRDNVSRLRAHPLWIIALSRH